MPTRLLLAPVGAGKTEAGLQKLLETLDERPLAKIWVLLPTDRQVLAFRQRAAERNAVFNAFFNIHLFKFYDLYTHLLDAAAEPVQLIDDAGRYGVMRRVLDDLSAAGRLTVFERIAQTPGFLRVVGDLIYELKQNLVQPVQFAAAARTAKDHDLALIYHAYQDALIKHHFVDREGQGWLALEALEKHPVLARDVALLLVDGYDQFNPLQARLLAQLAGRVQDTLVTLTTVSGREMTAGRRFQETVQRLKAAHLQQGVGLEFDQQSTLKEPRHPVLQHLADHIFYPAPERRLAEDAVTLIEAPDPSQEAAAVLRRVKKLLLDSKALPEDILIVLRDWQRYSTPIAIHGHAYDLPLALHHGEPLDQNPAVIAVLELLSLSQEQFRRRALIDVLHSPYFIFPELQEVWVDKLEVVSRIGLVTSRRDLWLEAIQIAAQPTDEEDEAPPLGLEEAAELAVRLENTFTRITPRPEASLYEYIVWIEALLGPDSVLDPETDEDESETVEPHVHLCERVRTDADEQIIARDLMALATFKQVLRGLLHTHMLLTALQADAEVTWDEFLTLLRGAVQTAAINRARNRLGHVLVTTASDARGLPHQHVFILGLAESIFPAPIPEDPLYHDTERAALAARGIPLQLQAARADDTGLFYELISMARRSLTLSRPTVEKGSLWPASPFWRSTQAVLENIPTTVLPIGGVIAPEDAARLDEALLAAAHGLSVRNPHDSAQALYNWLLQADLPAWERVALGRSIELSRLSTTPHNHYSGVLQDRELIVKVGQRLGKARVWSASQFNELGQCGFRFFAKRMLHLEPLKEPEDGMDRMQFGQVAHRILELTYQQLGLRGAEIQAEYLGMALEILRECAEQVLAQAPTEFGFRASILWDQEKVLLLRTLENFVRTDFSEESLIQKKFPGEARRPFAQESRFGRDGVLPLIIDEGASDLRVQGSIDRIDRQGDGLILYDYKTGSSKISEGDIKDGRNFQLMVYLLAAEQLLHRSANAGGSPTQVLGGMFLHIRSNEKGLVGGWLDMENGGEEIIDTARAHLHQYITHVRRGDFRVHPNRMESGRCDRYCDYAQLCRVAVTHRMKPQS